jgi:hypothetical protein
MYLVVYIYICIYIYIYIYIHIKMCYIALNNFTSQVDSVPAEPSCGDAKSHLQRMCAVRVLAPSRLWRCVPALVGGWGKVCEDSFLSGCLAWTGRCFQESASIQCPTFTISEHCAQFNFAVFELINFGVISTSHRLEHVFL